MNKEERIKELNSKILFQSRKMFGMYGNIQWSVVDIEGDTLIIRVSSSGYNGPSKEQIAQNIESNVLREVEGMKAQVSWEEWEPGHGKGFLLSAGNILHDQPAEEGQVDNVVAIDIACHCCKNTAATLGLFPNESKLCVTGFIGEITTYELGDASLSASMCDHVRLLAETDLRKLYELDRDLFGFICHQCGYAYCRECWKNMMNLFDEGFYDETRACCPKGHEQMIQD